MNTFLLLFIILSGLFTVTTCFSKCSDSIFAFMTFCIYQLAILIVEPLEPALEPTFVLATLAGLVKLVTLQLVMIFLMSMKHVSLKIFHLEMAISANITCICIQACRNPQIPMALCTWLMKCGKIQ